MFGLKVFVLVLLRRSTFGSFQTRVKYLQLTNNTESTSGPLIRSVVMLISTLLSYKLPELLLHLLNILVIWDTTVWNQNPAIRPFLWLVFMVLVYKLKTLAGNYWSWWVIAPLLFHPLTFFSPDPRFITPSCPVFSRWSSKTRLVLSHFQEIIKFSSVF